MNIREASLGIAKAEASTAVSIKPPAALGVHPEYMHIFLAGSIENGKAEEWQRACEVALKDRKVVLLNPRRDDYNPNAKQTIKDDYFRGQVEWELAGLERADLVIMYFQKETKAPISLLELGLFARSNKLLICCPEGYWRKGNVDIIAAKFNIPSFNTLPELLKAVEQKLDKHERNQVLI